MSWRQACRCAEWRCNWVLFERCCRPTLTQPGTCNACPRCVPIAASPALPCHAQFGPDGLPSFGGGDEGLPPDLKDCVIQ